MRESARRRILETLPDDAVVLDVGGWAVPFPRADWMLDLGSYETRGEWGYDGDHRRAGPRRPQVPVQAPRRARAADRFPMGFRDMLDEDQLVLSFWWEDSFGAREVIFDRAEDLDAYLGDFVAENGGADVTPERRRRGLRARR